MSDLRPAVLAPEARQAVPARARTLLVIPTYNEAGNIVSLLRKIHAQPVALEVLVIDDSSPDGTAALVESLASTMPVAVVRRPGKLGIGGAHKAGFRYAMERGYDRVITMDADFTHDPGYLSVLLAQADAADVVIGSRYVKGGGVIRWSLARRLITHTAHWLTLAVLRLPYDCTGGFRLYNADVFRRVDYQAVQANGYAFLIEMLYEVRRAGCSVLEVPVVIPPRNCGVSKISLAEVRSALTTVFRLAASRPRPARRATP